MSDDMIDIDAPLGDVETERREIVVPFEIRASGGDGLTLSGYAAVFNSPTVIAERGGEFIEDIAPGAFKRSIRAKTPVLQFDHGQHPLIGSMPIGAIRKLAEDSHGLHIEARMFDNWLTQPLRDAIAEQAVDGMSFRFSVVKETNNTRSGKNYRTLNEVKLYELGPVVFPAYADTSVALRSLVRHMPDLTALIGTPHEPADNGTSDGPADTDDPAAGHSRTPNQRRALALLALRKGILP